MVGGVAACCLQVTLLVLGRVAITCIYSTELMLSNSMVLCGTMENEEFTVLLCKMRTTLCQCAQSPSRSPKAMH